MTLTDARDLISKKQKEALRFWMSLGFDRKQIGRHLGYKGSSQVDNVFAGDNIFSGPPALILSRFVSEHGFDDYANIHSADDKMSVRVYTKANGEVDDDVATTTEGLGLARAAFRSKDPVAMAPAISTAYSGVQGLLAERELLLRKNGHRKCGTIFDTTA